MARAGVSKKKSKIQDPRPHVQKKTARPSKKHALKIPKLDRHADSWVALGFDTSLSSLAGAGLAYDDVLKSFRGPGFAMRRFQKDDHYFSRIEIAARAHDMVHDLLAELRISVPIDRIFIAVEEPWPFGMIRGGISNAMKQQAEMSGAFLGGLVRYGYRNIFQIQANNWRQVVAADLGITIHHSKWKDTALCETYNCKPTDVGKFRSKQWALALNHGMDSWGTYDEIPDWPDIITHKDHGKIPRPEGSKAKALQPDDRYDALAMAIWMRQELKRLGVFK